MRSLLSLGIVLSALGVVLAASPVAYAQVDCSNPDNLCTGDPCVIPTVEVLSPCQVDFGARTVIIAGRLRVPTSGILSLTANNFDVQGVIRSRNESTLPVEISLTATSNIEINGSVSLRGAARYWLGVPGSITFVAQNDIVVRKPVKISGRGGPGPLRSMPEVGSTSRGRSAAGRTTEAVTSRSLRREASASELGSGVKWS